MARVKIQFLMWLGKELGPDWVSAQDTRANMETEVPEGTTVRHLLDGLAERYPAVREKVFPEHDLARYVIATLNQKGMDRDELLGTVLGDGDTLTVLPIYVGG